MRARAVAELEGEGLGGAPQIREGVADSHVDEAEEGAHHERVAERPLAEEGKPVVNVAAQAARKRQVKDEVHQEQLHMGPEKGPRKEGVGGRPRRPRRSRAYGRVVLPPFLVIQGGDGMAVRHMNDGHLVQLPVALQRVAYVLAQLFRGVWRRLVAVEIQASLVALHVGHGVDGGVQRARDAVVDVHRDGSTKQPVRIFVVCAWAAALVRYPTAAVAISASELSVPHERVRAQACHAEDEGGPGADVIRE